MFVFLSKFLPQFVYPLGLSWILLLLVLFLLHKQAGLQWVKRMLWLVVVLLFVGGNQWVANSLTRSLEWRNLPPESLPQGATVVVLGGGTESQQYPRQMAEMNGAGDRVVYGVKLYRDGVADRLLLSGGNISWLSGRTTTGAEEMVELMQLMGVPADVMTLQTRSQNTREDALYSAEILEEWGVNEIVLVTSATHMPRSLALFQQQGLTVIPAPADFSVTQQSWYDLWHPTFGDILVHLLPNAGDLSSTGTSLKEYIGLVVYGLRGWL